MLERWPVPVRSTGQYRGLGALPLAEGYLREREREREGESVCEREREREG
jgi:hypothetical protein